MSKAEEITLHGLPAVRLTDASGASCDVLVYGAHVTTWKSADGVQNLYVSSKAEYGGGKAVRGGIPLCWPQFASVGPNGKHGFVRNSAEWTVVRTSSDPFPSVVLGLKDSAASKKYGLASPFSLRYAVTLDGPRSLSTSLTVINTGDQPIEFTGALHTYFTCDAVGAAQIQGLGGVTYSDSTKGGEKAPQEAALLGFDGEVDRIYYDAPSELYIRNVGADGRALKMLRMGFPDAVTWNIGGAKAGTLKDMGEGEWSKYVCLEAAIVGKPVSLPPSNSYTAGQTFVAGVTAPPLEKAK
jgi:glucose-6-phosphate 1-epimerase